MADTVRVKPRQGAIRGMLIHDGAVRAFRGIPYAMPPVGSLRWQPPRALHPWKTEFDARNYGHRCVQQQVSDDMLFQDKSESEDCLSLNVFTPASVSRQQRLPVMVWIHGGGFEGGSSSEPRHNGDFLPSKGVILVTINYRLGLFGFLSLPQLSAEQGGRSGNYGLMDMVAALRWVKANIGAFGGDPNNVTAFGESAGSFAVSLLMASPAARELFQRAIGESGGALSDGPPADESLAAHGREGQKLLDALGLKSLQQLRAAPAAELTSAAAAIKMRFEPVVDGTFLTRPVAATYRAGEQMHVPLLAGFNRDEGSFLFPEMTVEKWRTLARERFGDRAEAFLTLYPANDAAEVTRSAMDYGGDTFISFGTWKWLESHRATGRSAVYRYRFDLAAPPSKFHPESRAFHSDDIEYVFGTLDTRPGASWRDADRMLSEQIMSYWTNFAKTGNPNGPDLPHWPMYGEGDPVLYLDAPITSRPDENQARYEFLLDLK